MKPSVISNGSGNGNPPQPQQQQQYHHQPTAGVNAGTNPAGSHIPYQQQQDPSTTSNVRGQFPHFTQGFGLDPDMDDIFSDSRMRSRLPRMRDPFGTFGTRKPCGIDSNFDPYSDIFEDGADDFFSGFGRRRNPHDFFDFPEEFRQYIPDGFGVPRSGSGASVRTHQVHPTYQQHQPSTEHLGNTTHPQYAPQSPQYDNVPTPQSPKPNLCDASIQTDEDLTDGAAIDNQHQTKSSSGPKLNKKYSQENEENRGPRSQSAPPHQNEEIPLPPPDEEPVYVSSATFSTSAPQSQAKYPKTKSQGTNGMPPQPPQRQPQSFYLHNPNQGQTRQWPPPPQPQSPQQPYAPEPQTPGGTIIRTIPIFVEGRKDPIYNEHKEIPGQTTPLTQQQPPQFPQPQYQPGQNQGPQYGKPPTYQKPPSYTVPPKTGAQQPQQTQNQQQQYQQAPHQQTTYQQTPHKPAQQHTHPTVDINQPTPEQFDVPPQTPQTMDCINKIQNIQRDVLNLMEQVESFKGFKNDKEYMYLDEMLTRNLLKLDTIDTNGKDSIRLARKEAIRCIQASINVLEAKADENARKTGKFEIRHNSIEEEPAAEENEQNSETRIQEENPNVLNDKTVIPLPPPPEHKEDKPIANADIKKSNSTTVNKSPSQTSTDKLSNSDVTKKAGESIPAATDENEEQNRTEKVPSKSKIPVKGTSPTKDLSSTELNREKARSQSKSPSKSPAKSAAKEGAKKKIIKKIKKLTKKDSKDGGDGEIEKSDTLNEENDKSLAPPDSNEEATTEEGKPLTDVTEKKE